MKLLALDCSTEACSVALYENTHHDAADGGRVVVELYELAAREHTQKLLPMVEQVLAAGGVDLRQLDGIAFGRGPGSFTGLRIALSAVQGLAFGADLPVFSISSLAALAQTAVDAADLRDLKYTSVIAAIDARMDELYWGAYQVVNDLVVPLGDEYLQAPEAFVLPASLRTETAIGVGSGWRYAPRMARAAERQFPGLLPRAAAIARLAEREWRLGNGSRADQALPTYLRDEVTWQKSMPAD